MSSSSVSTQSEENPGLIINIFLFPYLVGGLIPGFIFGLLFYIGSVPIISMYQNRRKGRLKQKWEILKERAVKVKSVLENEDKED